MKKIIFILSTSLIILTCGCSSLTDSQLDQRKTGIVDACYTVIEYNAADKNQRIEKYLTQKVEQEVIEEKQKIIIKKCLQRTEKSTKWSVK